MSSMATTTERLSTPVLGAWRAGAQGSLGLEYRLIQLILLHLLCVIHLETVNSYPTVPHTHFLSRLDLPPDASAGMPPGLYNMGNFIKKPSSGSGEEPRFGPFPELTQCTNCTDPEEFLRRTVADLRLEHFKAELLRKLNMDKPPNVSAEVSLSKPVRKLLEREREELRQNRQTTGNNKFAEIKEIVSYGEEGKQDIASNISDNELVMFRLSSTIRNPSLKVMSASLYILLRYRKRLHPGRHTHEKTNRRVKINIYPVDLNHYERYQETQTNGTLLGSLGVLVRHTRWQKLNLPVSEIQKVLDSTEKLLTLKITCDNCGHEIGPVLVTKQSFSRKKVRAGRKRKLNRRRPLLIVHTAIEPEQMAHSIQKRSSFLPLSKLQHECPRHKKTRSRCQRRKLWISFKDIGWGDWILFPKGYYANYCEGSCPRSSIYNLLSSGHVQVAGSYSRLSDKHRNTPCCKPKKMAPLHLIYFDDNGNIVKTLINGMTTEKCGCA